MTRTALKQSQRKIRCAIYTRKSTEEGLDQDFNTLDAQRESGEAYVKSQAHEGWQCLPARYDDGGFTGGNMDRPALQQLLTQIQAGAIDCIVVYKVDRLSRSLLDFARMMEVFERHQVAFVSVTQQFNTASSMGRLILNVLLSFAQFEREMISERTRDKIAATRRKGKWCGGLPLLGYDVVDRKLVVNELEAEQVRQIFSSYVDWQSLLSVVGELERAGLVGKRWVTRKGLARGGRPFTKTALHQLLINATYTGKVRHKQELFAGEHVAIIDQELFDRVQAMLHAASRHTLGSRSRQAALLSGLLTCGACGRAMSPSFSSRGHYRYRYYVCTRAQKRGWQNCPSPSVPAEQIERLVVSEVFAIGRDSRLIAEALNALRQGTDDDASQLDDQQMAAALRHAEECWQSCSPAEQAAVLHKILKQVIYDAQAGQIALTFRPDGIVPLAAAALEFIES